MSPNDKKLTMLIADDSYPIRVLLSEAFKTEYDVLLAENGLEALELLRTHDDIVIALVDLMMPGVDGFKVISEIVDNQRELKIPIIVITSSTNANDEIHAVDLGATDVMHKPLNIELLRHKVRNLLTFTAQTASGSKHLMKLLLEQNEIDEKTGLLNKVAFCNAASRLMNNSRGTQFAITRFDVDGFKVLNDVYGINEGDRYLRAVGDFLNSRRSESAVFGRWAGDHFVACMKIEDFNSNSLMNELDNVVKEARFGFDIILRMGVYVVEDTSIDVSLMCDRALLALKSIKGDYANRIAFYDEAMRASLIEEQQITVEMESALKEGQFSVFLQPQINYTTGKLHGAEALVRWKHPRKGLIQPAKFIPIFEKNGFITHLDMFVWEEACRMLRKWIDAGHSVVPISVNVSRIDIYSLRLTEHFKELLAKYRLDPSLIRVEITESAYIDSPSHLINSVQKLRDAGYCVEMDDFGSGYSSLNTLKDVPFDLLKLDMKFIDSNSSSTKGGSILSSVVGMSRRLNLPVLAEGVETKAQADYLKSIGCLYMQGYYFSRPVPEVEYEKLLITNDSEDEVEWRTEEDDASALGFLNASTQHTLIFNNFVGGAAIIEFDGEHLEAIRINDRFYEELGLKREEFLARQVSLLDYLSEVNRAKVVNSLCRAIEKKGQDDCEVSVKLKEDNEMWIRVGVRLLVSVRDRHLFYMSIENVTQKMMLLMNNLRLNERLTGIVNSVPGGIMDFEIIDGKMYVRYLNQAFIDMFGFSMEEYSRIALEQGDDFFVHEEDHGVVRNAETELIVGKKDTVESSFRHRCKDGSYKWVIFSGAVVRRSEETMTVTGIILDFDYQMRFEQSSIETRRTFEKKIALNTALISSFPCGVLQYAKRGDDFKLFSCNEAAWKYLEYPNKATLVEEFSHYGSRLPVHNDDSAKLDSMINKVFKGKKDTISEERLYIKNAAGGYTPAVVRLQCVVYEGKTEYLQYVMMF